MKRLKFLLLLIVIGFIGYYFYPEPKLPKGSKIDSIVVFKSKRKLFAYSKGNLLKTYKVALGREPIGAKQFEGDRKTPEGSYFINTKNPYSGWYKNIGISYPNAIDQRNSIKKGKSAGGLIKIHGLPNKMGYIGKFHRWFDWTLGCIAVTNEEMEELYNAVEIGTKINIYP